MNIKKKKILFSFLESCPIVFFPEPSGLQEGSFQCNLRDISVFFLCFFFSINFYMNFPMLLTFMIKFKTTFIKLLAKKCQLYTVRAHCTDKNSVMEFQVSKVSYSKKCIKIEILKRKAAKQPIQPKWAGLAVLFSRQILNSSQNFSRFKIL